MQQENNIHEQEPHLSDYAQIVLRRKWIVIVSFITTLTFVTFHTFKATPVYEATTQIKIDKENPNIISFEEVMAMDSVATSFYETQYKLLSSRILIMRVINALNLKDNPEFKSDRKSFSIRGYISSLVKKIIPKEESQGPDKGKEEEQQLSALVNSYLNRLKVRPVKGSHLVDISFSGFYPEHIKKIVNRHAEEYISTNLEVRFAASHNAVEWLQKQVLIKRNLVEKAENALQLYKERKKIVSLEDKQNIIVQKLEDLNAVLTEARIERLGIEKLYKLTKEYAGKPGMIQTIPVVTKNLLIQDLKVKYVDSTGEIKKLSERYGKNHPTMKRATSKTNDLKSKIDDEVQKIIKSIETEYKVALSKEEDLAVALEEQKALALKLNRDSITYGTLKRHSEGERAMYEILLKRMKETDLSGELQTSNIRIVDPAESPTKPIKPRKKLNILLGIILGLGMGVGLAFFLEYLDNTIKSPEDVERYLNTPLLGVLEKVKDGKKTGAPELIAHEDPRSVFAEAVRSIRTSVIFSIIDKPKKLIMVTSAVQGEGKSFIASNLATAFAKTGKNTLLVDTDLRKPRLNTVFSIARNPGLSNHLLGEEDLESTVKPTSVPNLSIITCGTIPPNPSEMLESTVMEEFCKTLRERFDIVIFDTPPSMTVTDAVVLSRIMDGVIITIKSGATAKKTIKRCLSQFAGRQCELLGAIVNYANIAKGSYYYHYYAHYYKYGYSSEKELVEIEKG